MFGLGSMISKRIVLGSIGKIRASSTELVMLTLCVIQG